MQAQRNVKVNSKSVAPEIFITLIQHIFVVILINYLSK